MKQTVFSLLILLSLPVTALGAEAKAGQLQYEYKVYSFSPTTGSGQIQAELNKLGGDGWELVGVRTARLLYAPTSPDRRVEGDGVQIFLKRLIPRR
ncbi:MAG: hypothetical protein ACT4NU_13830 [Chromatiales bacterium]